MTSALEVIASGGLAQVGSAALRVLEWVAAAAGITLPVIAALNWVLRRRRALRRPTEPNPVAEFWERPGCPWCTTHGGTVCICVRPCASWICAAKAVDRG